ncbi:ATP phosphoribosyltransferase [Methanocaldococcus vulcanius M7]|uniref:ATP phosphoribosyltransferase n=1 Tax=Methanocaldococcus vulcanius (strain ATCC 700851 / DSM 12094 / M7) TaxID=579137 RepID=C9RHZ1_METVM|nr:ATP phosphoribosyltransferase [Methanocaldococcus vulcanius]ACX73193.1 ATP phosphoribosyltransferase [Methanocaldococcus vulcanius M7]
MIMFALPNKGRISEPVMDVLEKAGLKITVKGRSLFANTVDKDIKVMFARARDIPEFVADGVADIGVTGYDLVLERNVEDKVDILLDFGFGFAKLVLAAPENSNINSVEDIKEGMRVATEFPNLTKKYFDKLNKKVEIIELSGATEIAPFIGIADLISDLTSTGTTLKLNRLKVIDEIVSSTTRLIANKKSLENEKKKEKINQIVLAIKSALFAETKRLIMMNAPKDKVEEIKKLIPGMAGPTVSKVLSNDEMVAIHAVVNEDEIFSLVPKLHDLGARDILVVPIERIL